jgi:hypothetical protein
VPPLGHADGNPVSTLAGKGRVLDWSFNRIPGRSTFGVTPERIIEAAGGPTPVDWNITTGAPVTASPATYGPGWTTSSTSDVLYFAVNGNGSGKGISAGTSPTAANSNVFALTNLYTATPTLKWSTSVASGVNRNGITVSLDGSRVYVLDSGGHLYCFTAAGSGTAAATCSNGSTGTFSTYSGGNAVNGSSPWYDFNSGDVYFGDDAGYVHRVNGTTGAVKWKFQPGPTTSYRTAIKSSPVVFNGFVYIGDDYGQLFRILDYATGSPTAATSDVAVFNTCSAIGSTAPCPSAPAWAVRTSIAYDTTHSHVYAVANDYAFELNATGSWAQTSGSPKHLSSGGTGPMQSSPVLDFTNGFVYAAFNNKVFKITYPFAGSSSSGFYGTSMAHSNGGSTDVVDSPLPYNGVVYIGDSAGYTERFDCTTQAGTAALDGVTFNSTSGTAYGNLVNTSEILDWASGNVNFGYSTSGGGGGLVQYPLASSSYECPTGKTKLCTQSNGPSNTCTSGSGTYGQACRACCTSADCSSGQACSNGTCGTACTGSGAGTCPTVTNATATCNTDGTCSYACATGWGNCDNTVATNGCNIDLQNDINNCGACSSACSNSHIPSPVCVAGSCAGHCADGYVDCNNNRQSDGCEMAASNTSCCGGAACSAGTTCYDNGSTGTCVTGQSTQAYDSISEHSTVTATCPTGQVITGITFADYGTPGGSGGQSWTMTQCGGTDSTSCNKTPGCTFVGSACVTTCSQQTQANCLGTSGCAWESNRTPTQCVATQSNCGTAGSAAACALLPWCSWSGSSCLEYNCGQYTTSAACTATSNNGCAWNSTTGICTLGICTAATTSTTCAATGVCSWDSQTSTCNASSGFLHDYHATTSTDCAMDVSANFRASHCIGSSSCTIYGQNGNYCGNTSSPTLANCATDPAVGTALPLTSLYPSDPCTGIYKRVYIQTTCGPASTTASFKRVFVSATTHDGDFTNGGTAAVNTTADALCAADATSAGLTGTYKAWLGSASRTAASVASTTATYVRVDARTTINVGLPAATLTAGISTNNVSTDQGTANIWTGFTTAGAVTTNCSDWTDNANGNGHAGETGTANASSASWTAATTGKCGTANRIYCIEQ